ncbi:DegT/DnrJ/EryC1/StrS family aminotransferase [Desulfonatronovibrio magnus]|uniref:DegT/DnrJ/EryC1/StrS family aminotransferase n=1 Tax=Desulfonatronovibrio magnus TaxID=698827 RepID=UPI0005EB5E4C|nr:DegT/DnrJ/EryC1/StrS family aminotransferase [Desulfonatronovibrio magnus]
MNIPFIDLKAQFQLVKDQVHDGLNQVLEHGAYVMGPEIKKLEVELADLTGANHALACSSGTDALILSLLAMDIKPGDAVLTTPFTFFATAEAIAFLGAVPVFADIDAKTFNISPKSLEKIIKSLNHPEQKSAPLPAPGNVSNLGHSVPEKMTPKAIISVDLFGQPCDYKSLNAIAREENLALIVDAAQSFGATYKGKSTCSLGQIACTSFFPAKPLGCYGDGGMCFTNDEEIYALLESLRVHGQGRDRYENVRLGMNARMDTFQAAVLLAKLAIFPDEIRKRQQVAENYNQLLKNGAGITVPEISDDCSSAWAQYSLVCSDAAHRERILENLKHRKVPWAIYYPLPLHMQKSFHYLGYAPDDFPVSHEMSQRIFSLPMHPYLRLEEQEYIAQAVLSA